MSLWQFLGVKKIPILTFSKGVLELFYIFILKLLSALQQFIFQAPWSLSDRPENPSSLEQTLFAVNLIECSHLMC